ncbi:MAG TPA: wax ester/triacylglycerol synthase family O-acyltransferase [Mycobacteriales bacterium]|nr:wax ester/triacylglycerol synthase family O-acyltransferase [Mycobacteriales bacterium]
MPGVDAGFLYMETPTLHMHTIKVALLDVSSLPSYRFESFKAELMSRLHLLPPFRRRVVEVPMQLNHPLWVEDREVDPDRHVLRQVLPEGSGMAELEDLVGRIASTPLDRSEPLWEMHVVEGLGPGRIAVVTKMHHAMADGLAANALLANITDEGPGLGEQRPLEPAPVRRDLALRGLLDAVRQLALVPRLLARTLTSVLAVLRLRRTSSASPPRPILDTPRTSFNGAITARRTFATATLPLDDLKRVRKAVPGTTLNDVVLAVVAGAMRSWLDARGEHLDRPLTAGVPVGTDAASGAVRLGGNRVSTLFTCLHTDVVDPVERLRAIARTTETAKGVQATLGPDMLADWSQFTPPAPFRAFMRAYSRRRGADRHRAPFNLVVSNVPGPKQPVSFGGARMTEMFSVGPILEGIALNVTVWSYLDQMHFSLLSCPDNLADLRAVATRLQHGLDELLGAAL